MTYSDGDFRWWDLEESGLDARLYNILAPIQLGDRTYNNSWEQFERENPGGAYAWRVGSRYRQLEESIVALRPIQKLLANPKIPVSTSRGDINREEWLRMTVDLFLFRFSGIRDHCLHLVNEIYELGLKPVDVRMSRIAKTGMVDLGVISVLETITKIAPDHRAERNRRAHEGFQRRLVDKDIEGGHHDDLIFKIQAMDENSDGTSTRRIVFSGPEDRGHEYDVAAVFGRIAAKLDQEFVPRSDQMVALVKELVEELEAPFIERYLEKPRVDDGAS